MDDEVKVFHSEISRVDCREENHLYDLLEIEPAVPVPQNPHHIKNETWDFIPNYDKHYIPRFKGSKLKVKTVSDIRALFEEDIYSYLPNDLEKQQNYLIQKIRDRSSCEEKTSETAIKLLNADKPISRAAWQILANINPEKQYHPKQFVLWNGKCIQVNGSKGGKTKFICKYDLKNNKKTPLNDTPNLKNKVVKPRIGLLRNSLRVKFKPGPLGKKKFLDASHHKYQMGDIELIKLPKPVLEISTAYGAVLEPTISSLINGMRGEKGVITPKFAEFAISALGTVENNMPLQLNKTSITFDMNYKCDQNRLLMRRNVANATSCPAAFHDQNGSNASINLKNNSTTLHNGVENNFNTNVTFDEPIIEIKKVVNEMLNAIEISLKQDSMFSTEDEPSELMADDCNNLNAIKDKPKRRYCELDKLDITVIKLPENSQKNYNKPCGKSFCTLGCICESIDCAFNIKQHCGVFDCMFNCKCDVSKYKNIELLERDCSDIIPSLLHLDNEINSHLAKEEKKFHQTVIVSGEKSILLKSQKRNWKSSKKYAEFYRKMNLKSDDNIKKILTVDIKRLTCENIEPLCMVHNLYKCFCKGKFTESYIRNDTETNAVKILHDEHTKLEKEVVSVMDDNTKSIIKPRLHRTRDRTKCNSITGSKEVVELDSNKENNDELTCARTMGYNGRKYTDGYYTNTNIKIMEMERNDDLLRKKMLRLMSGGNNDALTICNSLDNSLESRSDEVLDTTLNKNDENHIEVLNKTTNKSDESNDESLKVLNKTTNKSDESNYPFTNVTSKNNLTNWLGTSYKSYKERMAQGLLKNSLDAPKKGKAALQSWDFILSRYRERKNIFFVSKQEPFRTYLAVDSHHPFFSNCINIDDIRFADLRQYPVIIQNLVTNATDSDNSFCILRGWDHCWELIGSAVRVFEKKESKESFSEDDTENQEEQDGDWVDKKTPSPNSVLDSKDSKQIEENSQSERSKWFVMTVENDFTEIQFYKKGFFVTYDGIQRSISLARISGKTVRLSSQARADKSNVHQFGIYAIPSTSECCVFIGPYDINEPLGIEIVKTFLEPREHRKTRGVWITTNKVDNVNVIEHPLSFLSSVSVSNENVITLDSSSNTNIMQLNTNQKDEQANVPPNLSENKSETDTSKTVKPIKIRRTNGFYHLSKNMLQKIPPDNKHLPLFIKQTIPINKNVIATTLQSTVLKTKPFSLLKKCETTLENSYSSKNVEQTIYKPVADIAPQLKFFGESIKNSPVAHLKPIAEIAPQIKISSVYSERDLENKTESSDKNTGMLVLKPEEINKKILVNNALNEDIGTDIEKFLETSTICIAPEEVLVISDEDEDEVAWKDVWIQCVNVDNFGWIRGRLRDDQLLSFEFPGFKYSDFYTESEAYEKMNQVLARKIYIPKNVKLQWQVILDEEFLTCDKLTPTCLADKKYLLIRFREQRNKKRKPKPITTPTPTKRNRMSTRASSNTVLQDEPSTSKDETVELLEDLEQTSKELDQEGEVLLNKAITIRNDIYNSLGVPDNLKPEMTETLQGIMSMNDQ